MSLRDAPPDRVDADRRTADACRCDSRSWSSPTGEIVVLSPVGEIDLLTLPVLSDALGSALGRAPRHLVVDLGAAPFCGAHTFALLTEAATDAANAGISYAVAGMSRHQNRIATIIWGDGGPRRYLSTAAAVIAIHDIEPV